MKKLQKKIISFICMFVVMGLVPQELFAKSDSTNNNTNVANNKTTYIEQATDNVEDSTNVALGKPVVATHTAYGSQDTITDGIRTGDYWDGGNASKENPQGFTIDLGAGYIIDTMKAYPYVDGYRRYDYYIETSLDGVNWDKQAERTEEQGDIAYSGETFEFDNPINARFVRVNMTHNTANPAVHMHEFEVYGVQDPNYQEPESDQTDPDNIAFGKTVRSHLNTDYIDNIVDGIDVTSCVGSFAPAYFDIDLEQNYDLEEISLKVPTGEDRYYYFTIYGSTDGSNYDRLYQERSKDIATEDGYKIDLSALDNSTYRIVRVYLEYVSDTKSCMLSEVRVHGTATDENKDVLRNSSIDEILGIKPYSETEYSKEITDEETIKNIYGIIDRNIGKVYRDWFTFELKENPKAEYKEYDYYTIENDSKSDKILISGNDGVSLASGLNYYLKNYCKVNISEQANQTKMPSNIVALDESVYKYTPYEIRYGFNYCTLNYSFSYANAEEFQKEYDWLALNGVNCVLDLAGQEAVWIKFLMNYGYSFDEAKDWLTGPTYYAWQFMDNMEVIGGPVSDEWVNGRLEMARENQRWKNSLGMQTVLQGYAGMVPNNFADYQDVEILEQGNWEGTPRPDMIRTDGELYDEYATAFYKAQEWAFGNTSDYYAVDPFHEGGIRPDDLTDEVIADEVLNSLLEYDKDAVWMVQAWYDNPTNELLNGMGDNRDDHVLILDLNGMSGGYWDSTEYGDTTLDSKEFNGTSWVWCMLENFGGNPSMDGNLQYLIDQLDRANQNSEHMKGIGIISEATHDNPVIYELIFDMVWQTEALDLDSWLDDYVIRRYGAESESAREAWDLLLRTVYGRSGLTTQTMVNAYPNLYENILPYTSAQLENALKKLFDDYDLLCSSEAYLYDLTEIMRQVVNNFAIEKLNQLKYANDDNKVENFIKFKEEFLNAFDVLNEVCGTQQDLLVGQWVGKAADWAIDTKADDFAYDSMTMNAKTLITVWAPTTNLVTYAFRNYEGMITDIYKVMWETYLEKQEDILETGSSDVIPANYIDLCMDWIYTNWETQNYTREADNSPENVKAVVSKVLSECSTEMIVKQDDNIAINGIPSSDKGASVSNPLYSAIDNNDNTLWIAEERGTPSTYELKLDKKYEVYKIQTVFEKEPAQNSKFIEFEVEASIDGEWVTIGKDKTSAEKQTIDFIIKTDANTPKNINKVRVVITSVDSPLTPAMAELRVYSSSGIQILDFNTLERQGDVLLMNNEDTVANIKAKLMANVGEMVFYTNGKEMNNEDIVTDGCEIKLYASGVIVDTLETKIKGEIDKIALKIAIDLANAITDEDLVNVVPAVVNEFKVARDEANAVYNDASATQDEVNVAFNRLASAMHMLDFTKGDKTVLKGFINQVSGLEADKYTNATWTAFEAELNEAVAVYEDVDAMQEEVNEAYSNLVTAFLNLRLIPNKDLLKDLINQTEGLDSVNYTTASYKVLSEALVNAKATYDNPNATQEEVDNVKDVLAKAITGLQTVTVDNTVKTTVNNGDTTSVKTGDGVLVGSLAGLALLSIAGAKVFRKKKVK